MRRKPLFLAVSLAVMVTLLVSGSLLAAHKASASSGTTYDITTLAGKVASLRGTAGLQLRFSAFLEQEADDGLVFDPSGVSSPINPTFVLSSPLDGTSIAGPAVTVNGDTAGAPQNETAIAVDPNNPNRVVAAANDYVTRTWNCTLNGLPCSAQGDGYSGTYFSNDGGATWCCASNLDGTSQGTLIPGVDHLSGGQYDAGGDPALAFDSQGNVYYAGLGFDRTAPPNTVAVNRGAFDGSGHLSWSAPTFINQTTSPSTLNDKEWIAADHFASSPFRDRVYVSYTRFIFNAHNGAFVQAPIQFVYSTDGGQTFSAPKNIVGNVIYDQGSRPVVGPDGAVYVFFKGSTRLATLNSTYVVKSTDGGVTFGQPVAISTLHDIAPPTDTAFRVNSFPAAAANPVNGDLYAAWSTEETDANGHHAAAVYSVSHDGGASWSTPALIFPDKDTATRTPDGYGPDIPISPDTRTVDTFWPGVTVSPNGRVYLSAYAADVVSPWQTCAQPDPTGGGVVGRINCLVLGPYINNARLDYAVRDLTTGVSQTVSTHPINTRSQFGGGFIGDYTDISAGSDDVFHALWTDTNNKQTVIWFYGFEFQPTIINQEDIAVANDNF